MHPWPILRALILLALANGTPVIAKKLLAGRFAWPLDGGVCLADGRPLLGASKTVRGLVLALLATALGAALLGLGWTTGILVGLLAMAGDLASSFVKRRLGRASSSRALGLDQLPESLLPLWLCMGRLGLDLADVATAAVLFFAGELLLSRLLFMAHIRDEPY